MGSQFRAVRWWSSGDNHVFRTSPVDSKAMGEYYDGCDMDDVIVPDPGCRVPALAGVGPLSIRTLPTTACEQAAIGETSQSRIPSRLIQRGLDRPLSRERVEALDAGRCISKVQGLLTADEK